MSPKILKSRISPAANACEETKVLSPHQGFVFVRSRCVSHTDAAWLVRTISPDLPSLRISFLSRVDRLEAHLVKDSDFDNKVIFNIDLSHEMAART